VVERNVRDFFRPARADFFCQAPIDISIPRP
jgi:hypothetical protein